MRISFLLHNGYHYGGTIRTTFTLAEELAERHEVEIVSVFRHRDRPWLGLPAGVTLRHLVDLRKDSPGYDGDHPDFHRPAEVFPRGDGRWKQYSALTDARIGEYLRGVEADVLVATRPGLNVHLARQARRGPVLVGQEHLILTGHSYRLRRDIGHEYALLDAVTTVTEADARAYRKLRLPGVRVEAVPNSVPAPAVGPADPAARTVVAAGRLTHVKRYDVLIDAFASVAADHPDWKLRIYGSGDAVQDLKAPLARQIKALGLDEQVFLMGTVGSMEPEWVKGSIAAVTSQRESFGMTIVEAMRCGLPVVSTDCPHGPREIIEDGVDGRLVPVDDVAAVAAALRAYVESEELRAKAGRAALTASERFDPARVAARHEALWTDLVTQGASRRTHAPGRARAHRAVGRVVDAVYTEKARAGRLVRRFR
ncbi:MULTISPECIES: glycosyltransferase family 4 protein [Streptomyces]|jgi:glycosyltransferase involved in cell wall biosynthesis|uniref:D-inositol 3-phosphate glycosyltransferase n=1 Tax=Streptomyces nymphaeiformis TaxID=2663842 RepID=A0A7W7U5N8_9ACTN|nr:glycosyltransferase family 4 protein [Streptomyces nymphaeiformis]MBB4985409.1 glycosyltransferase involved in cell wall biosynthesis [Streptomyces nymphaeiformis]